MKIGHPLHRAVFLICLTAGMFSGCYSYHEVERARVGAGTPVRVRIASDEAVRQAEALGDLRSVIEGVVSTAGGSQELGIIVRRQPDGPAQRSSYNSLILLPTPSILQIEEKRFNLARTAVVAGGAAAVAVAALTIRASRTSSGGEPPPVEEIRIPLIRW